MAEEQMKSYYSVADPQVDDAESPGSVAETGGGDVGEEVQKELAKAAARERERLQKEEE